ncbi:hypothetical protein D3C72_1726770 [compost metagenome]
MRAEPAPPVVLPHAHAELARVQDALAVAAVEVDAADDLAVVKGHPEGRVLLGVGLADEEALGRHRHVELARLARQKERLGVDPLGESYKRLGVVLDREPYLDGLAGLVGEGVSHGLILPGERGDGGAVAAAGPFTQAGRLCHRP